MSKIHLNIGSNTGDRHALIERAIALLSHSLPCTATVYRSDYIESEPWGFDSSNPFLNIGLMIITDAVMDPHAMLDLTQQVEQQVGQGAPHRNPDGTYRDRPIDIDIIDIDSITLNTPRLTLPHPRAHLRSFVTIPMHRLEEKYKS